MTPLTPEQRARVVHGSYLAAILAFVAAALAAVNGVLRARDGALVGGLAFALGALLFGLQGTFCVRRARRHLAEAPEAGDDAH